MLNKLWTWTCPHGNPVEASRKDKSVPLSDLKPGRSAKVVRIADEQGDLLRYLATLGLLPGVDVRVTGRAPFRGPLMISVGDAAYALGSEVCRRIWVLPAGARGDVRRTRKRRGRGWRS